MTVPSGWPETKQEIEPLIAEYWTHRDEIGVYNGVLYKGDRVIVPTALRKEMMKRIHASLQGQQACLRRAKDALFWPGMSSQIKEAVSNCSLCAEYQTAQPKEPLITPELPSRPWSIVAQDLYSFQGNNFFDNSRYIQWVLGSRQAAANHLSGSHRRDKTTLRSLRYS